jgi:hypothetical protein
MAPFIMFLMDADRSIMRASGRGLGPLNQDIFGSCEMNGIEPVGLCHLGPKKSGGGGGEQSGEKTLPHYPPPSTGAVKFSYRTAPPHHKTY